MSRENWQEVERLLNEALELPPANRSAFLDKNCSGNNGIRTEVESLLACEPEAEGFLQNPALSFSEGLIDAEASDELAGQQIGRYRIVRELGRGGMGAVYLAERTDEDVRQLVALKLLKRELNTADLRRRFGHERRILAGLEHPQITRLLDVGSTSDGLPYFVMEYVDGVPINDYCRQSDLSIEELLKIFRTICDGVAFAHRKLVVHRDLKPSNILVTEDGTPKLLDFGIAKLLTPEFEESSEHTVTSLGAMSLNYASPEQLRGLPVSTATDIYSLGVVLYELLTGRRPFETAGKNTEEIVRSVCETEPQKPSAAATGKGQSAKSREQWTGDNGGLGNNGQQTTDTKQESIPRSAISNPKFLRGDLDNIVLMALRKEPERRYSSVEEFSEDIRRHLEGLPVIATTDTFGYRASKFVKRHKIGVASASLILLALIAGLTTTIWQARAARGERARAERRFNDVRQLANSNLFELHDAIANLPGSTPARGLLVKRALEYLDSLAQESQDDASLQRELIAAYLKVGNVQGNPSNANLGDTAGALQSYRKALAITEQLTAANPADAKARRFTGVINEKMCDVQAVTGEIAGAVESQRKSLAIFKGIAEAAPANVEALQSLAISYVKLGDVLGNANFTNYGDQAGAMQSYRSAAEILDSLYASDPANPKTRRLLGLIYERIGTMLELSGKSDEALAAYRKSLAIREPFAADNPTDTDAIRDVAIAHEKIGNVTAAKGELKEALERRSNSLKIFKSLVEADPQNVQARQSLALSYVHLGEVFGNPETPNLDRPDEARKNYLLARDILSAIDGHNADVKTRKTIKLIEQRLAALRSRP